jgi:hypothetical protein
MYDYENYILLSSHLDCDLILIHLRTKYCLFTCTCSRNDQQYALNCTIPLVNILAPTCFGSGLPSSGSFLDPSVTLAYPGVVFGGSTPPPPRNSEVMKKLGQIPSFVEYISVTT